MRVLLHVPLALRAATLGALVVRAGAQYDHYDVVRDQIATRATVRLALDLDLVPAWRDMLERLDGDHLNTGAVGDKAYTLSKTP